ncbi:MAG: hypothetical protein PHE50_00290 [Dehalococcoidales bacterium]|nr:hypothetical protein [Dehalococcoidales bacterium]
MFLRNLTDGKITGTGTIDITNSGCKAIKVLISTNNSAAAAVIIRKDGPLGQKIFDMSTITAGDFPYQAVLVDNTNTIYYDISGTAASAQIYGYII